MHQPDYERFMSATAKRRQPDKLREIGGLCVRAPPTLINLAPGFPNVGQFPFKRMELVLGDGETLVIPEELMEKACSYSPSDGMPAVKTLLREFVIAAHNPPTLGRAEEQGGLEVFPIAGCTDGQGKVFEMVLNCGDYVILEEPSYPGALTQIRSLGARMLSVKTDQYGMVPESLRKVLSAWKPEDARDPNSDIPKLLYVIPCACNPSGATMTLERKQEVYKIAQEYDLLILEDDPYYYLQFSEELKPSFLSMDVDGRVIRCDSFAKILAAGMRVGFISGPFPLLQKFMFHMMVTTNHANGFGQAIILKLFEKWGHEGFIAHCRKVALFYKKQRDAMAAAAKKWLTDYAEWFEPEGGMFFWIKLKNIKDTKQLIMEKALKREVIFVPGSYFMADIDEPCNCLRACYSYATPEDIDKGFERLVELIKDELAEQEKST